jgi:rhamnosyltransferase subunit B
VLAIISAPGSRGDVNPMIAIGRQLRSDGFDVLISLAEPYAPLADAAGLTPVVVIGKEEFDTALASPKIWTPVGGARAVIRLLVKRFLRPHFQLIQQHHRPGQTVLVSHPLDLSSRIYRDLDVSTPLIDVHLAPTVLRMPASPTRITPWSLEPRRPAWLIKTAHWFADRLILDPLTAGPVNQLRAEYSLPPVKRVFHQWWLSPDKIIAMYPKWFAPETEVFSPRLVHAGFPLADLDQSSAEVSVQGRPFVFTAGTANHHCRAFFQRAADACVQLNHPGLLLSTFADNFPQHLPSLVRTESYLSLAAVLPQAAAIVHHGGIGTTSQALAAGTPQLIRPMAFDQFDNASRVMRLGCGTWLRNDNNLAASLQQILDGVFHDGCKQAAGRFTTASAVQFAAREVKSLLPL